MGRLVTDQGDFRIGFELPNRLAGIRGRGSSADNDVLFAHIQSESLPSCGIAAL
jgi:hypothetical protein